MKKILIITCLIVFMLTSLVLLKTYALFQTSRSYKFVGKYGIFYIYRPESATKKKIKVETDICNIYYLDIMIDFVQDRVENKKVLVNLILHLFDRKSFKKALKTSEDLYKLFISCLDKVLKMTKIHKLETNLLSPKDIEREPFAEFVTALEPP